MGITSVALIDDLTDNTDILSMLLTDLCGVANVDSFNSGAQFLQQFRPNRYAVILLDLLMPEMDGYEVLRCIREVDSHVPIIALTAHTTERGRALNDGFTEFVSKPVLDVSSLCGLVRKYLGPPCSEKTA
jgi:CheY-like chemotaxis protein